MLSALLCTAALFIASLGYTVGRLFRAKDVRFWRERANYWLGRAVRAERDGLPYVRDFTRRPLTNDEAERVRVAIFSDEQEDVWTNL